jgi:hypothetical protein
VVLLGYRVHSEGCTSGLKGGVGGDWGGGE